jgi:hypothetical protein
MSFCARCLRVSSLFALIAHRMAVPGAAAVKRVLCDPTMRSPGRRSAAATANRLAAAWRAL